MKEKTRLLTTLIMIVALTIVYAYLVTNNYLCDKIVNYSGIGQQASATFTKYIPWSNVTYVGIGIFLVMLVISFMLPKQVYANKYIAVLILIILTAIPKILQLGTKPMWDSCYYYGNFYVQILSSKLALSSFIDSFKLCAHPTYAYAVIWLLGTLYPGEPYVGFQLMNIIMGTISVIMVWDILSKIDQNRHPKLILSLSTVFGWLPLLLGTVSGITPDYGIAVFFTFLLWSYFRNKKVVFLMFSIWLVFTKEIGTVILAGFWCGHVVLTAIKEKHFKKIILNYYTISMTVIGILMLFYYLYQMFMPSGDGLWGGDDILSKNGAIYFDISFIWLKLKTWICLNFNWLMVGISLILTRIIIKRKINMNYGLLVPLLGSLLSFEVFDALFHTNNGPRYEMVVEIIFFLVMAILMITACDNEIWLQIIVYILSGLMLVSSFITIDPATKGAFTVSETGSIPLVNLNMSGNHYNFDTVAYNYQYTFLQRLYDIILDDVDYSEDKVIIVYGNREDILNTWICGAGHDDARGVYYSWDNDAKQRVLAHPETTKKIEVAFCSEDMHGLIKYGDNMPEEAIYISVPFFGGNREDEAIAKLSEFYEFSDRNMVSCRLGGKGYYYKLRLKDEEK